MDKIIGIDLGTTKITASVIENGKPIIIATHDGFRSLSTISHVDTNGKWNFGQKARYFLQSDPEHTVFTGINYLCNNPRTRKLATDFLYPNILNSNDGTEIKYSLSNETILSSDIIVLMLKDLIQDITAYLEQPFSKVIVSTHIAISRKQQTQIKKTFEKAGLNILRIIDSPTAITLNYEFEYHNTDEENIVIFDLGAESVNVSLMSIGDGLCETLSLIGSCETGGNYFTLSIIDWLINEYRFDSGLDIVIDSRNAHALFIGAEKAKIELSLSQETTISIDNIHTKDNQVVNIRKQLTRNQFEQICSPLVKHITSKCKDLVSHSNTPITEISKVIISGGASRMNCVQTMLLQIFGLQPTKAVNPEESNAYGCALYGGILTGELSSNVHLSNIPFGIGYTASDGNFCPIINNNSTYPVSGRVIFTTTEDNQTSLAINLIEETSRFLCENTVIDTIVFDGIQPQPQGVPQIEIAVWIEQNKSCCVFAKDFQTNREIKIEKFGEENIKQVIDDGSTLIINNNKKRFCPDCGSPQQGESLFCSNCGHRL